MLDIPSCQNLAEGRRLLVTGGTGSFGNALIERFLGLGFEEIRVFSRDEKKQNDMRLHYGSPRLRFYLGDVRDPQALAGAMRGIDYVFHAAALKQVPSCEFYPLEALKTNVLGAENVLSAALEAGVRKAVCLSTDKAVYPVSAMGMSKAMMEKVALAKARAAQADDTSICTTRYGNVIASRGSVVPLFLHQIRSGRPITITDPEMTRFMMTLDEAVELVLLAFSRGRHGEIFVPKTPATSIATLAQACCELLGAQNHPIHFVGTRHGEKRSETLLTREEHARAEDLGLFYRVQPDTRELDYAVFFEEGDGQISRSEDYTSEATEQLDLEQTKALLRKVPFVQAALASSVESTAV